MDKGTITKVNFTLELVKPANLWIRRINKEECQQVMAEAGAYWSESGLETNLVCASWCDLMGLRSPSAGWRSSLVISFIYEDIT